MDTPLKAPDFPNHFKWLNTHLPLDWESLKGHIVLLDFWTYCCINCIHVLDDLKYLEKKFEGKPFVVIGVHSAKFDNETVASHIQSAICRYEISHPVLIDQRHEYWNLLGVKAWPSLVLVSPEGNLLTQLQGEGHRQELEQLIDEQLKKKAPLLAKKGLSFSTQPMQQSTLSFPGKLALDEAKKILFIADSNHNQILCLSLTSRAKIISRIGSGQGGLKNGNFKTAQFNKPQGLCFDGLDQLYVCDTANHALRKIDLALEQVTTLAGTGEQGSFGELGGQALETSLNSPWDCVLRDNGLFVAMSGFHQIWRLDTSLNEIYPFAGCGLEDIVDGSSARAQLAQPSGLALDENTLFFVDSETSSLREVSLKTGEVKTRIGQGLFEFGHVDGLGHEALLQHPMGLCTWKDLVFIADTYNHALRIFDTKKNRLVSLVYKGPDQQCVIGADTCHELSLFEPNDVKIAADQFLYIADTNNHLIRVFDLQSKKLMTLKIVD